MNAGEFILTLFNARTAAHVAHLQTQSYAKHKALNEFYDGIVGLADDFAEAYIGCYGPIEFKGSSFKLEKDPIKMLEGLKATSETARAECGSPSLQNIIDEIINLISSTLYKLKFLA